MNAANEHLKDVETLTVRVLDNLHDQEDMDRLSALLSESAEARSRYSELVILDSMLHWETSEVLEFEQPAQKTLSFPRLPMVASFAAAIIALCSVWLLKDDSSMATVQTAFNSNQSSENAQPSLATHSNAQPQGEGDSPPFALDPVAPALEVGGDSPFVRSIATRDEVSRGLMILQENKRFAEGGLVQFHDDVVAWNREEHVSVPTEQGILPLQGDRMIKLSKLTIDVQTQSAESSDAIRILDLRDVIWGKEDTGVSLNTSVYFNQGVGIAHGTTEFSLTLHAIQTTDGANRSIGHKESKLSSDLNPSTWEELSSEFEIPKGTDYLVVALNARKEGSQALLPDFGGHYADQLSLNLVLGDQKTIPL